MGRARVKAKGIFKIKSLKVFKDFDYAIFGINHLQLINNINSFALHNISAKYLKLSGNFKFLSIFFYQFFLSIHKLMSKKLI